MLLDWYLVQWAMESNGKKTISKAILNLAILEKSYYLDQQMLMFLVASDRYFHMGLCQHVGVVCVTSRKTLGSSIFV
jgi:hypothetical protein